MKRILFYLEPCLVSCVKGVNMSTLCVRDLYFYLCYITKTTASVLPKQLNGIEVLNHPTLQHKKNEKITSELLIVLMPLNL